MSKILVDTIDTRSGTTTLTLGSTNAGTIALGSGDVQSNFLYPAFEAYNNGDQSISNATYTKMEADTERFDTNNNYASNRFTPTVAGKYFVYAKATLKLPDYNIYSHRLSIYKNGSGYMYSEGTMNSSNMLATPMSVCSTIDMNGSSDYVEIFGYLEKHGGSDGVFESSSPQSIFGAYRIGT